MSKFISVRTVAYASVTGAEIQNAYIYKNFTRYIVNCDNIDLVGPLEGYLTNNVYQYFRVILKSGVVLFCHYDDYVIFEDLCKADDMNKNSSQMICENQSVNKVSRTRKIK